MPNLPRIANANEGPVTMEGARDADGHRTWNVVYCVRVAEDDAVPPYAYGPAAALQCPGLPFEGTLWQFNGMAGELDVWAWCRTTNTVKPSPGQRPRGPIKFYDVSFVFSTRPPDNDRGGRQQPENQRPRKEDPLAEQDKISGSFVKYSEEAATDRFGAPIVNTAFEPFRGPQVEFDRNRPQIRIEQNVVDLQLPTLAEMCDCVNDREMWGFPARCIKLGVPSWERKFHGNGLIYFTRTLEFDINAVVDPLTGETTSGFDRDLLDEGSKVLQGKWNYDANTFALEPLPDGSDPNPGNPNHYAVYTDRKGQPARVIFTSDPNFRGYPLDEVIAGGIDDLDPGTPIQVTSANVHGLSTGDYVAISGVEGIDEANGVFRAVVLSNLIFTLLDRDGNLTTGTGTWTVNTGRWFKLNSEANKVHVEKYDEANFLLLGLPTGY